MSYAAVMKTFLASLLPFALAASVFAQNAQDANAPAASPAQNRAPKQLPPPGVAIPEKDRAELTTGAAELGKEIAALKSAKLAEGMSALIPDVEIFHKAVDWALRYDEFYDVKQVATARDFLREGKARAAALRKGKAPWTTATGFVVRGYRSRIDGSVQPFGVVVPTPWKGADDKTPRATWIWNHGRNETLSELAFIADRMKNPGEFRPADTFVVHPYGRYCNATKFAGEVDVFEALDAARRAYPVDNERLVNAGFSMGGASAWHLGAHYAGMWAASHAGAGFAETAEYAGVFAEGKTPPPWWEVILCRWYDATICAANFANSPMFAYHGSEDKQKQATEIMKRYAEKEAERVFKLVGRHYFLGIHEFIGVGVGHKYEPETKGVLADKLFHVMRKPTTAWDGVGVTTHTLRYPRMDWVQMEAMERQWESATIIARVDWASIWVNTENVAALSIKCPVRNQDPDKLNLASILIDSQDVSCSWREGNQTRSHWHDGKLNLVKTNGKWAIGLPEKGLHKVIGLTGPVDDAFMDAFVFVKPTGAPLNAALGEWTQRELAHATKQWRGIFRGEAPSVDDTQLSDAQIAGSNLVLWGDPSSNAVLKRIADKLPVKWTKDGLKFGGVKYDAATHVPILIFPNPLNPRRYIVLNSGFTFSRAAASGTNALQTPKLPDWAIVDTTVPPDDKFPGKIVDAGFFDEQWKFTKDRPK